MEGQSFEHFLRELKVKVCSWKFGVLKHSLVRHKIVDGVRDDKLRERLLRKSDLALEWNNQNLPSCTATGRTIKEVV